MKKRNRIFNIISGKRERIMQRHEIDTLNRMKHMRAEWVLAERDYRQQVELLNELIKEIEERR